jgi:hypothetical protein
VSGDQDAVRCEVKASVPLVVRGVSKKHTTSRAGRQLVRSSGGGVRVTRTPEDPKEERGGGVGGRPWLPAAAAVGRGGRREEKT